MVVYILLLPRERGTDPDTRALWTEQVRERFQGVYGLHGMGEQREDVKELAELAVSICAVDVAEVFLGSL